jgi:hypothetical protein
MGREESDGNGNRMWKVGNGGDAKKWDRWREMTETTECPSMFSVMVLEI